MARYHHKHRQLGFDRKLCFPYYHFCWKRSLSTNHQLWSRAAGVSHKDRRGHTRSRKQDMTVYV